MPEPKQGQRDEHSRERFIAIGEIATEVAHELRNTLQVISACAYVARQNPAGSLEQLVKIERHARIAHAIVDDLMSLARGDATNASPTLVAEVLVAARTDIDPGAAKWDDDVSPSDLRARIHAGLITRLLHVLYENAILVTAPRPPLLATRARRESDRIVIEVADDGPGVPASIRDRVFEPLVSARPGGTGLGLALARRIAAAHGGTIALLDTATGATFRIELPAA